MEFTKFRPEKYRIRKTLAIALAATAVSARGEHIAHADEPLPPPAPIVAEAPTATTPQTIEKHSIRESLSAEWASIMKNRQGRVDVAVFDSRTGETIRFTNSNEPFKTASIIKLSILERLLMVDAAYAHEHRSYVAPMITVSDNEVAEDLWANRVGGTSGMQTLFNDTLHIDGTRAAGGGGLYNTLTTAPDQLEVVKAVTYPGGPLSPENAEFARQLMREVIPGQRWGISGGVPADVLIENKNGWVNNRRNSIGHVSGRGVDYVFAALTDDGKNGQNNEETISLLAAATWRQLSSSA